MTNPSIIHSAIAETIDGARGAAASLGQIAIALAEVTTINPSPVRDLKFQAGAVQNHAQRAALAAMSLSAHAGRLEAFAHAMALEDEAYQRALQEARTSLEAEAETDAKNYVTEGETAEPAAYAAEAFDAWVDDEPGAYEPMPEVMARAVYVAAFVRAVRQGGSL